MTIDNIKARLNGTIDEQLNVIYNNTKQQLNVLLEVDETPQQFNYIIEEVSVIRAGRLNSEGYTQEKISTSSVNYLNPEDDFKPFLTEINNFKSINKTSGNTGGGLYAF